MGTQIAEYMEDGHFLRTNMYTELVESLLNRHIHIVLVDLATVHAFHATIDGIRQLVVHTYVMKS